MNPSEVATETNFIFRRLGEAFPADWFGLSGALSYVPMVLLIVTLALLTAVFGYLDQRRIRYWVVLTTALRVVGVVALIVALTIPDMVLGTWENVNWLAAVGGVLVYVWSFVISLYARDARTAGWKSIPLACLRAATFALLAFAFLLPAREYWEVSEKRSRVALLIDLSPSMSEVSDEQAMGSNPGPTRLSKVVDALLDADLNLLDKLRENKPVVAYRFGSRLDDETYTWESTASAWTRQDWNAWLNYDFKAWLLRGISPPGAELVTKTDAWQLEAQNTLDWATTWSKLPTEETLPATLPEADAALLSDYRARLEKRIDLVRSISQGTNVPDATLALINRESGSMLQGVIVFSDGRSNLGSDTSYAELRERAEREKVPIITVAVGEAREVVGISITDVQAPDRTPPDEPFKLVVEADGIGLADQEVEVFLDLYLPGRDLKEQPKPDYTLAPQVLKFAPDTTPPHGSVEFTIDADDLPESLTEDSEKLGKQRQLKSGEWKAIARIARDKRELFPDAEHISPPRAIQVLEKPTRILLFAGGPTREYQTLRTLLVRETAQNRVELSICLQSEGAREGFSVQDVPPERMLTRFPTTLDTATTSVKPEEKYYNLNEYDLIIAFDPDWSELSPEQFENIQRWVDNLGGGLITVAGPLNLFQLARGDETGRVRPMLELLPVILDDIILVKTRPEPRTPRRLILKPNPQFDLLKLEDEPIDDPTAGWEGFFTGGINFKPGSNLREALTPKRGFFSYYPVVDIKPGATVLAEFLDVNERGDPEPRPWIVTSQPARGRIVFLASGEFWRFRAYKQDYFDRFWVKLARFAAGNRDAMASRGRILIGKEFNSGSQIRVQTRLLAPTGKPYDKDAISPKFRIEQYDTSNTKEKEHGPFELKVKPGNLDFDGYYVGQITADPVRFPPGDKRYRIIVDVPDSAGDRLSAEFSIKRSNPELDNTRPDFAALERIAGTVEEIRGRVKNSQTLEKLQGSERDPKKAKLAYRLSDRDPLACLPEVIDTVIVEQRNRGPVRDLWDRPLSFDVNGQTYELLSFTIAGQRVEIGWLLCALATLLSLEWLTRKLLRMA